MRVGVIIIIIIIIIKTFLTSSSMAKTKEQADRRQIIRIRMWVWRIAKYTHIAYVHYSLLYIVQAACRRLQFMYIFNLY
jgi:hypothetical protein